MKKTLKSFLCAFCGVFYALINEAHMRFHLVAAVYVTVFGIGFYNLSATQWAILCVLFGCVMSLEAVNTAIERVCDAVTLEKNKLIKTAKDTGAGAVLIMSLAAVAVAVLFFWDLEKFKEIFNFYINNILWLLLLLLSAVLSVVFVATGFSFKKKK